MDEKIQSSSSRAGQKHRFLPFFRLPGAGMLVCLMLILMFGYFSLPASARGVSATHVTSSSPSHTLSLASAAHVDSSVPAAPGAIAAPTSIPGTEWWVDTFANAPAFRGGFTRDGTMYAGTNYVFCKEWGAETTDNNGGYNRWWFWTDLDTGGQGWVSAYYLSKWSNDQALDNNGNVIPDCPGV